MIELTLPDLSPRPKLAAVWSHHTQVNVPLFREITSRGRIDLEVLFMENRLDGYDDTGFARRLSWDIDLASGYEWTSLGRKPTQSRLAIDSGKDGRLPIRDSKRVQLENALDGTNPDVVLVPGHAESAYRSAMRWALANRVPYILRGTGRLLPAHEREFLTVRQRAQKTAASRVVRSFVRRAAGVCAIGVESIAFARHFGARNIWWSPYAVDEQRFNLHRRATTGPKELRRQVGLDPELPVLLYSGKLVPWKGIETILAAYERVRTGSQLVFVGDGPAKAWIPDSGAIRSIGFVNQSDLPIYYSLSDVLVLPSFFGETWGLVVNEAMACGAVPIVSSNVGCRFDLVEGLGAVVPAKNADALAAAIDSILPVAASGVLADRIEHRIKEYSIERAATGIEEAVLDTLRGH